MWLGKTFTTPSLVQKLFPRATWHIRTKTPTIFLTFDDGPEPEVTPWVLDILKQHEAKATFFCIGKNVEKHSDVFKRILDEGHSIGNHTYDHLNGWRSNNEAFLYNIKKSETLLNCKLFRPPYGKLTYSQYKKLREEYQIVMWDVLSRDFDSEISKEKCFEKILKYTSDGSIVVFHDSLKAKEKLLYLLPKVLEYFSKHGFNFERIEAKN